MALNPWRGPGLRRGDDRCLSDTNSESRAGSQQGSPRNTKATRHRNIIRGTHDYSPKGPSLYCLWGTISETQAAPTKASRVACIARHASEALACRRSLVRGLPHPVTRRPGGVSQLLRSGRSGPPQAAPARAFQTSVWVPRCLSRSFRQRVPRFTLRHSGECPNPMSRRAA